jgi:hypothetical protein
VACTGTMSGQCACFITLSGDGESPSLITISFLIPHLHVPGWHPYLRHWCCGWYIYNSHWSSLSEDLRPPNLCRPWGFARTQRDVGLADTG